MKIKIEKKNQALDLSYFIKKNCFDDDVSRNYLIVQPVFKSFETFTCTIEELFIWNSKGLSEESITTPATPSNGLALRLM